MREKRTYYVTGDLATLADGKGNMLSYSYDGFRRLKQIAYPGSATDYELHGYDAAGNEQVTQNRSGQLIRYTHDALNRVLTKAPAGQAQISYGYDYSGRVLAVNRSDLSFTYTYDGAGRAIAETRSDAIGAIKWTLDANGNRTSLTAPGNYVTTMVYDALNRLTDVYEGSATTGVRLGHYDYNALSQRSGASYGPSGKAVRTQSWTAGGQVYRTADSWNGGALTLTYGYNLDHQRKSVTASDGSFAAPSGLSAGIRAYASNALNQYIVAGGATLTYDTRGNLIGDGSWTYGYDVENHLVSASKSGIAATYAYDALGRRGAKTVNGVTTFYASVGDQEIAEYDGSGTLTRRYVYGPGLDEPLAMMTTAGASYHLTDALGSVIGLVDGTGTLIEKHAYTAYGQTPAGTTPWLYAGRRYDEETGLYHNRARAYSPLLGRFLQADPIGTKGGINLYAYVGNDPLNGTDPMGLKCNRGRTSCSAANFDASRARVNVTRNSQVDTAVVAARGDYQRATKRGGEPTGLITITPNGVVVTPTASKPGSTLTADTAKFNLSGADAGVHGHLGGTVLDDLNAGAGYGDTQSLEQGKPMYTVEGNRVGVHDAPGGQLRFEMLNGRMTPDETRAIQRNLNEQQKLFLK